MLLLYVFKGDEMLLLYVFEEMIEQAVFVVNLLQKKFT